MMPIPKLRTARLVAVALTAGLVGVTACASGGSMAARRTGGSNRIIESELLEVQGLNALDAVQRLRPFWLTERRGTGLPGVIVDRRPQGGLQALTRLLVSDISEMSYLSASDATTKYGTGYPAGAIEVSTKR